MSLGLGSSACLAVARLDELKSARSHQDGDGQPMHGFCLINGDQGHYRVTLYIENGRTLAERSGPDGFYYEGWLIGPDGPTSLGAFNLGPEGKGSSTRVIAGSLIEAARSDLVRVTAEPFGSSQDGSITVLEGSLVWLETGASPQQPHGGMPQPVLQSVAGGGIGGWERPPAAPVEASPELEPVATATGPAVAEQESLASVMGEAAAQPAPPSAEAVAAEAAQQVVLAQDGAVAVAEDEAPPVELKAGPEVEAVGDNPPSLLQEMADAAVAALAVTPLRDVVTAADSGQPAGEASGRAGGNTPASAQSGSEQSGKGQLEPRYVNPLAVPVQLVQRHPMAPRAAGSATLNLRQGTMTMTLRGLPSPTALGRDRTTNRPFNIYRVWLVNQETGVRTPVGYCERAWGENFRFQGEGLPLNRHDTVLVTAEDRTASEATQVSPQVLIGSYTA